MPSEAEPPMPPDDCRDVDDESINCYSYAFNLGLSKDPGEISTRQLLYDSKPYYSAEEIKNLVLKDMKDIGKEVRVISSPDERGDGEYVVAMKTTKRNKFLLGSDYHFAVQLSDGTWADKPGKTPSQWNRIDGEADTWPLSIWGDFYDTPSVYFAVKCEASQ